MIHKGIKKEAREIVDKYVNIIKEDDEVWTLDIKIAKHCALIDIDNTIKVLNELDDKWHDREDAVLTSIFLYEIEYQNDLKKEVEQLKV